MKKLVHIDLYKPVEVIDFQIYYRKVFEHKNPLEKTRLYPMLLTTSLIKARCKHTVLILGSFKQTLKKELCRYQFDITLI